MAILLDGTKTSKKILSDLKPSIASINDHLAPNKLRLDIVMGGNNPASTVFVKRKEKAGLSIGVEVIVHHFDEDITEKKLMGEVVKLGKNKLVHGIVVQLPLPRHVNDQKILDIVPWEKDVDVLGYEAAGKFYTNSPDFKILPSTLAGILWLFKEYGIDDFAGKNVVVAGAGRLVGKPAINYFMRREAWATAFNIRSRTSDKKSALKMADIIISGMGSPDFITGEMVKEGVIVADAGTAKHPETGKLTGDIDFASVEPKASYITHVPGGVGPMTVAMIFYNLVQLSEQEMRVK